VIGCIAAVSLVAVGGFLVYRRRQQQRSGSLLASTSPTKDGRATFAECGGSTSPLVGKGSGVQNDYMALHGSGRE